jgi:hypothetical protein
MNDERIAKLQEALEEYRQTILRKDKQLVWYSEGIAMLMALMNGRGVVAKESAERKVYDEWRSRGRLLDVTAQDQECTRAE